MFFRTASTFAAALSSLGLSLAPASSVAQNSGQVAPNPRVDSANTRAGHLVLGAGLAWTAPHGRFGESAVARDYLGDGVQTEGDLSLGLSQSVAVGIGVRWTQYREAQACNDCSAHALGVGPQVRYHLVQGTRFDPWLSAAAAYRRLDLSRSGMESDFAGVDLLDLRVGGDWYVTRNLGVGPFLGFNTGVLNQRPDWAGDWAVHWALAAGARLVFDHPGK